MIKLFIIMVRGYIYLISFEGTNDIYIGKTQDIKKRFLQHRYSGTVSDYYMNNFEKEWTNSDYSKMYIDIIDSIDYDENLSYLYYNKSNKKISNSYRRYTEKYHTISDLLNHKLTFTELFHIHNYKNDGKYNLLNKNINYSRIVYDIYIFYNYTNIKK